MSYILAALFALTPTYLIRFQVSGLPLNFLEIAVALFLLIWIFWILRNDRTKDFVQFVKDQPRIILSAAGLFVLAGLISTVIASDKVHAFGMFVVLFIQPILCYLPAKYILREEKSKNIFLKTIAGIIFIASLYGIFQYFTLTGLPSDWWGNNVEPKRAISFFGHPNTFALWLTPLLALLLPFTFFENNKKLRTFYGSALVVGLVALILSGTRGAWIGFIAATGLFVLLSKNRKVVYSAIILGILTIFVVASTPNLRYRVILPFKGEKSTVSRFSLWHTANKMIKDSPLLGKGLYGYQNNFEKYNTDPGLAPINHPHNIFLTFWVETGLLGLVSFLIINIYVGWHAFRNRQNPLKFGLLLFLIAIFVHGLADSPYIINSLALTYWLVLALAE
jgi:putative inorganic carbon (hco3(-)) transporter